MRSSTAHWGVFAALAAASCLFAPSASRAQQSSPAPSPSPAPTPTRLNELPVSTGRLGKLHVTKSGRIIENTQPAPGQPPLSEPPVRRLEDGEQCGVVSSHTAISFTGGTYTLQAGFGEGEIAAVQYFIPATSFPIKLDLFEVIFGTSNAVESTTTEYSIFVWQGNPSTGQQIFSVASDGDILPHIVVGPGTAGTNLNFSVDPTDPDQIIINDDGSHSFSIGVRIDRHNAQTGSACFTAPPSNRNAFPATDNTTVAVCGQYPQLQQPALNWLFGENCGPNGCPANGGWTTFAGLQPDLFLLGTCIPNTGCRPRGDWVMRATWSSIACTPGVGACCLTSGVCQFGPVADCTAAGGVYQGDGSTCLTVTCPQPQGACCFGNGACLNFTQSDCTTAGGTYLGDGTQCAPNSVCPLGACCLPDGSCSTLTQQQCTDQSGTFRGVGSSCATANCPPPQGGCCLDNGGCLRLTPDQCVTIGGRYLGNGSACAAGGACPTGACCLADGCQIKTAFDCANLGGTFRGVGVTCAASNCPQPTGACCLGTGGACLTLTQSDCQIIPGSSFAGANSVCGACAPPCPADFSGDGILDPDDLSDYIAAYFAAPPGAGTDFNSDGVTDPDDLSDFISAYFAGC